MFQSLKKINNPLLRIITAGLAASAIVTMLSAVIIGWKAPKNQSSHKIGVYGTLIGGVVGALVGLTTGGDKTHTSVTPRLSDWSDWRNFVVTRKVVESEEITSFYLQPQDSESLPNYKPGQFLTLKLEIPGQARPVIRTYSLSDYSQTPTYYRLSIKREGPPPGLDVPPGIASNFMHDRVQVGTVIPCKPPNGRFFLDLDKSTPAVLISNGVGITPMLAMAKASVLQNRERRIWFVHGARNGQYHACREEISQLVATNPQLQLHYRYSRPEMEDRGQYHSQGYVDSALIQELIGQNLREAEYFLCGSPAFMDSLRQGLQDVGVSQERIFFESFSKTKSTTSVTPAISGKSAAIVFSESQQTLTWTSEDGSILELAEANNINSPFSCRAGICLTCMCKIQEGEVEYEEPPIGKPDEGTALICVAKPKSDRLVLEL